LQAERLTSRVGSISPTSSGTKRDFYSALAFDEQPPALSRNPTSDAGIDNGRRLLSPDLHLERF